MSRNGATLFARNAAIAVVCIVHFPDNDHRIALLGRRRARSISISLNMVLQVTSVFAAHDADLSLREPAASLRVVRCLRRLAEVTGGERKKLQGCWCTKPTDF